MFAISLPIDALKRFVIKNEKLKSNSDKIMIGITNPKNQSVSSICVTSFAQKIIPMRDKIIDNIQAAPILSNPIFAFIIIKAKSIDNE